MYIYYINFPNVTLQVSKNMKPTRLEHPSYIHKPTPNTTAPREL